MAHLRVAGESTTSCWGFAKFHFVIIFILLSLFFELDLEFELGQTVHFVTALRGELEAAKLYEEQLRDA